MAKHRDYESVRFLKFVFWGLLVMTLVYFLRTHWVRAYSDPVGWLERAIWFYEHQVRSGTHSLVYPFYLYWPLRLLGPHYVYISNLAWIIFLCALLGIVTMRLARAKGEDDRTERWRLCIWVLAAFVFFGRSVLGELINPYREAVAFSLLVGAFYFTSGAPGVKLWHIGFSGFLFGLSAAMREPHIIILPSFVFLLGYITYCEMPKRIWMYWMTFFVSTFLGMLPFWMQNYVSSGFWWIPEYIHGNMLPAIERYGLHPLTIVPMNVFLILCLVIAISISLGVYYQKNKRQSSEEKRKWLIRCYFLLFGIMLLFILIFAVGLVWGVIPLMNMDTLRRTGPKTFHYVSSQLGRYGRYLFGIGIVGMLLRREWKLMLLTVPSVFLFMMFWSFYSYVKPRYVFSAQLFLFPVVAYGAHVLFVGVCRIKRIGKWRILIPNAAVALVCLGLACQLGWYSWHSLKGSHSLKVWEMSRIRDEIGDVVDQPVYFDCANWRHTCVLAGIMATRDRHMLDIWRRHSFDIDWQEMLTSGRSVDVGLAALSHDIIEDTTRNHIYDYGPMRQAVRFWLDREPVIDLETVSGRLDLYGRIMDDDLYKLVPWSRSCISISLADHPASQPLLAGIDLFRLWDYPERTYVKLVAGSFEMELPVTNHFVWIELPASVGREDMVIESDAPLPADPYIKIIRKNESITIDPGVEGDYWYRNYIFPEYEHAAFIDAGRIWLRRRSRIQLPVFAHSDKEVYTSFLAGASKVRGAEPAICTVRDGSGALSEIMLERGEMKRITLALGSANEHFAMRDLVFDSPEPGRIWIGKFDIWSLPRKLPAKYTLTMDEEHVPWVQNSKGIYAVEQSSGIKFAWSSTDALLVLPAAENVDSMYRLTVTMINHRPAWLPAQPEWFWNGNPILPFEAEEGSTGALSSYRFDSVVFTSTTNNTLGLLCKPFVPSLHVPSADSRALGLGFVTVEWEKQ